MNIDLNAQENILYKKRFVAYLDILGFKDLVFSNEQKDKEKLNKYFGIINSVIDYLKNINSKKAIESIVISDSVILSVRQRSEEKENIDILKNLFIAVGLIQKNLALKDIWLRGAISSGETYFNSEKRQIVGPAYINAYLLEKSLAISPRVIIDSRIINELNFSSASEFIDEINETDEGGLDYSNWDSSILFNWIYPGGKPITIIKNDVPLFIDYLAPIVKNNSQELLTIIKNIENNIYKNTNHYKKFRWITDYLKSLSIREEKEDNIIFSEALFRLDNL